MTTKKFLYFACIILIVSLLNACTMKEHTDATIITLPGKSAASESAGSNDPNESTENTIPSFLLTPKGGTLKQGSLIFTIDGAEAITDMDNIPNAEGFSFGNFVVTYSDNKEVVYHYPEFVQSDGSFIHGVTLILVHMVVESDNAAAYTKADNASASFDDPYLFRADTFIQLIDLGNTYQVTEGGGMVNQARNVYFDELYFSKLNECSENEIVFRLSPGEKTDFYVGFLVGNNEDGSERDLSQLCISIPGETIDDVPYYISLDGVVS